MGSQQDWNDAVDAKRAAFVIGYRKGDDHLQPGADHQTYGIDVSEFDPINGGEVRWWGNKIAVYGDEELRDRILAALQGETK